MNSCMKLHSGQYCLGIGIQYRLPSMGGWFLLLSGYYIILHKASDAAIPVHH